MGQFGGFFKGDKKKIKKGLLEKRAQNLSTRQNFVLPQVEVIKKGKNEA
jgi:hypothetical protein